MKVIRQGKDEPFDDMFPGTYEFKLCGGSVEPGDRVSPGEKETADPQDAPQADSGDAEEEGR